MTLILTYQVTGYRLTIHVQLHLSEASKNGSSSSSSWTSRNSFPATKCGETAAMKRKKLSKI